VGIQNGVDSSLAQISDQGLFRSKKSQKLMSRIFYRESNFRTFSVKKLLRNLPRAAQKLGLKKM
jgi:hypothetical protein